MNYHDTSFVRMSERVNYHDTPFVGLNERVNYHDTPFVGLNERVDYQDTSSRLYRDAVGGSAAAADSSASDAAGRTFFALVTARVRLS